MSGDEIKPAGVIPNDMRVLHCAGRTRSLRNQSQCAENEIDNDSGENHRHVKNSGNPGRGAHTIIFRVDHDDRDDEQVGVNKRNYAAKTDAMGPEQTR